MTTYIPHGVIPANLLPFTPDMSIDAPAYRRHLRDLAAVDGITAITTNGHAAEVLRRHPVASVLGIDRDTEALEHASDRLREFGPRARLVHGNFGSVREIVAAADIGRPVGFLADLGVSNYYIHADAALSGMILPFVDEPQPYGFDAGIDSVAVSGHKMIGAPVPCGVVLTRRQYVSRIARSIEYIGTLDTTIAGSRSAFAPLMIWYAFQRHGLPSR